MTKINKERSGQIILCHSVAYLVKDDNSCSV